jgi:hypothetical protein
MIERLKSEPSLYLEDETAWLEQTAELIAHGRFNEIDCENLSEYLTDMARRDRREVLSRLTVLLVHMLKWDHQPQRRSGGWEATIKLQRAELEDLLESGTLRNHAAEVLAKAYDRARAAASAETGLSESTFSANCPYSLPAILGEE